MFTKFKYLVNTTDTTKLWNNNGYPTYTTTLYGEDTDINSRLIKLLPEATNNLSVIDTTKNSNIIISTSNSNFAGANVQLSFISEYAGYYSVLGYYMYPIVAGFNNKPVMSVGGLYQQIQRSTIDNDDASISCQNIMNRVIIFPSIKKVASGGSLRVGECVQLKAFYPFTYDGSAESSLFANNVGIGFFIIPNGWDGSVHNIKTYTSAMQSILYSDSYLNVSSSYPKGSSQMATLYDSNCSNVETSSVILSFEDIRLPGGDKDFNDVIFRVIYGPTYVTNSYNYQQLASKSVLSNDAFLAKEQGLGIDFIDKTCSYLQNSSDTDNYNFVHKIESSKSDCAYRLNQIFTATTFAMPTTVDYDGDKIITLNYTCNKSNIADQTMIYKSEDNQTALYFEDETKNIKHLQSEYLFSESETGNVIIEHINIYANPTTDTSTNNLVCSLTNSGTNRCATNSLISLLCQGDPHITTIRGSTYTLQNDEGIVEMYNNGEIVINTLMSKIPSYARSPLEVLRTATFMEKTAIKLSNADIVVNNHTLAIESKNNISKRIEVYPINKPIFKKKTNVFFGDNLVTYPNMTFRFIKIRTLKAGSIYLRFVSVPDILDVLNEMNITNRNLKNVVAKGAMVDSEGLVWKTNLMD